MSDRLKLSRADLAKFLTDPRQIRQFESLFSRVDAASTTTAEEASLAAFVSGARAEEAASAVSAVAAAIEAFPPIPEQELEDLTQSPPSPPSRIDLLEDVAAALPAANDALQFDSAAAKWVARAFLAGLKYGGGGSDYSFFEADGTLVFNGAATIWKDIDFPIIIRTTGANIPSLVALQGNITAPQWAVGDFNVCEGQELIHEWKEGSTVQWHIHMITNGSDIDDRWVNWEVEWCRVNPNGALSAVTIDAKECLIPAGTATKTMLACEISTPAFSGGVIAGHVFARLRRIANTTPGRAAPTSNPWCSMLQIHVECDTVGSRQIFTK